MEIFLKHVSEKRLMSKIYKKTHTTEQKNKQPSQNDPNKNWERNRVDIFLKTYKWPTGINA